MPLVDPDRPTPSTIAPLDVATLVGIAALWGAVYLFARVAAPEVGPLWVGVARVGLAAIILLAMAGPATFTAIRGRPGPFLVVALTSSAIPFTLIAFSALTLPVALGGLLNATTPMFTAVIGAAWLGQRVGGRVVAGLVVGLAAVVVLLGWAPIALGPATIVAALAALGAAANFAIAGTAARHWLSDVPPIRLAAGQMTIATLVLTPLAIAGGVPTLPSPTTLVSLAAIGIGSTAIAWPLFFRVLRRTTATAASTVTFIIPGFAILWGALALGEGLGPGTAVGLGLVLVSLTLVLGLPVSERFQSLRRRAARLASHGPASAGATAGA